MIVRTFGLFQNPLFNEHTYQSTRGGGQPTDRCCLVVRPQTPLNGTKQSQTKRFFFLFKGNYLVT